MFAPLEEDRYDKRWEFWGLDFDREEAFCSHGDDADRIARDDDHFGKGAPQTYRVLHAFSGGTDGQYPYDGLARDAKGNLYGTTQSGGADGLGTIFKVNPAGKETILYSFRGGADGALPVGGLLRDSKANLYGTTSGGGGANLGTIFQLTGKLHEVVLYSFNNSANGFTPLAGLVADIAGNLYGTTFAGGPPGLGTVYKLRRKSLKEVVLRNFTGGSSDGSRPWYGSLVRDAAGNMYGTTLYGGNGVCGSGCGVVFKLDLHFVETILYSFAGGSDGESPLGGLFRDVAGNLYGTTSAGGALGGGTVFKLDTTGKETILYSFAGGTDGVSPAAGVIQDTQGNLYGTTQSGGSFNGGTIFKLDPTGKETVLHSFNPTTDGTTSVAPLVLDAKGNLYGTAKFGGPSNAGVVFELKP